MSVISPCFNGQRTVKELAQRLMRVLTDAGHDYEIVLVDDGSTDNTWQQIAESASGNARIKGLRLSRNFGQHPAILAGLDNASGQYIVLMDSDLDDSPELIPSLLGPLLDGSADIVLMQEKNPRMRRWSSRVFHFLVQKSTKSPNLGAIRTYRAFNSMVLGALRDYRDHSSLFGPLSTQIGFRKTVIDMPDSGRRREASQYSLRSRFRLALPILLNEIGLVTKVSLAAICAMASLIVLLGAVALSRFVTSGGDPFSTTSLVFIVLMLNQALLGLISFLIALYARNILRETLRRPRYHIAMRTDRAP